MRYSMRMSLVGLLVAGVAAGCTGYVGDRPAVVPVATAALGPLAATAPLASLATTAPPERLAARS